MRKVILSLVIVTCAVSVAAQTGITPLPKEKLEGPIISFPETVVKELYRVHRNGYGHVFEKQGRKLQQKFFDQKLAALIWKNLTQTPEGEVGNIDFDPLYNAQDTKITAFQVGQPQIKDDQATVLVSFRNFRQATKLTFHLRNTKAGWKISNIDYGADSDLVKVLSEPQ